MQQSVYTKLVGMVLVAMLLSSCHTPLYRAAERGDADAARALLTAGADVHAGASAWNKLWQYPAELVVFPLDLVMVLGTVGLYDAPLLSDRIEAYSGKTPAEAAWKHGHRGVLEVLAAAGAAVAPDSVKGRTMLLQEDYRWEDAYEQVAAGDVADANVADCFERYWAEDVDWQKNRGMRLQKLAWPASAASGQVRRYAVRQHTASEPEQLVYRRTGVNSAEITVSCRDMRVGGALRGIAAKYELIFTDSAYGEYRCLSLRADGVLNQYAGRFWLR